MSDLHFVFLQGMPSTFFSRIGHKLSALGCKVTRINLCFGDWLFWHGPNTVNYRGKFSDWAAFISTFFDQNNVSDLVLLGEQRSYHKLAIEVAKAKDIRVTVTDFGYLRPDWITLEKDGMSGNSAFSKNINEIMKLAPGLQKVDLAARFTDSFWTMAAGDIFYSFGNVFLFWMFPHYRRPDKRANPFIYFPAMGKRLLFAKSRGRRARRRMVPIIAKKVRYFVFPLQLEHDFQIVAYSRFDGLEDPIRMVIKSFAEHADATTHLIVKPHPWDPGLKNWEKLVSQTASALGISDRVVYVDGGNLDEITNETVGMVTVNSTSGLKALQLGKPVKALGQAVYDIAGLAHQGHLDTFWTDARPPDPACVDAFVNTLATTIQIRGVFFNEPGLSAAVNSAAKRLYTGTVGSVVSD